MKLVIIESPYAGNVIENVEYARAAMKDCLLRGEAPYASHLLYTQPGVLDDDKPDERTLGINAGLEWGAKADKTVVYTDLGMSRGMEYGIANAKAAGREIEFRTIESYRAITGKLKDFLTNNIIGYEVAWDKVSISEVADSLKMTEIIWATEDFLDVELDERVICKFKTWNEFFDYVESANEQEI